VSAEEAIEAATAGMQKITARRKIQLSGDIDRRGKYQNLG